MTTTKTRIKEEDYECEADYVFAQAENMIVHLEHIVSRSRKPHQKEQAQELIDEIKKMKRRIDRGLPEKYMSFLLGDSWIPDGILQFVNMRLSAFGEDCLNDVNEIRAYATIT